MIGRPAEPRLGPLEYAVLDRLWQAGPCDVASVHRSVGRMRRLTRNTIHSTLERLVRKQLAAREKRGRAFWYTARVTRNDYLIRSVHDLLDRIPHSDAQTLLAGFVDFAERTGESALEELEELVRRRRRSREDDEDALEDKE